MTCCFHCSPLPCSLQPHPGGDRCIHCDAELGSSTHCGTKWSNTWLQGNLCNNLPSSKDNHRVIPPCRIISYSTASLRLYRQLNRRNQLPKHIFSKDNYNADFIRRNTYKPAEHNGTNANPTPVTTATIPYIKGTSETIVRILQPYNIRVAHKPITTLRQLLTNVKDKDEPNDRQGAVYKIKCCDC